MLPPPSSSSLLLVSMLSTSPAPDLSSRLCSLAVLWPCGILWSVCLAMLSSLLLRVRPIQVHYLRRQRRIQKFLKGGIMYQPRRHLSQTWTTNCMPFTAFIREKAAYWQKFWTNRGRPTSPPPLKFATVRRICMYSWVQAPVQFVLIGYGLIFTCSYWK